MSWYRDTYLKSEDWKNLRLLILTYQDYICECCGGRATDVHHLLYRKIWDVTPNDLMACCRNCHNNIHKWLKSSDGIKKRAKIENRLRDSRRHRHPDRDMKRFIANYVSPREMVVFNILRRKDNPVAWNRMTIYSKDLQRKIRQETAKSKESKKIS